MDELAYRLGVDPVELRVRNHAHDRPARQPVVQRRPRGVPADRGGDVRLGRPRPAAAHPARRRLADRHRDGRRGVPGRVLHARPSARGPASTPTASAVVQTGTQEFGTGVTTVMTQVAADALGLPLAAVRAEAGDTDLPNTSAAVGSAGAAMVELGRAQRGPGAARPARRAWPSATRPRRCTAPIRPMWTSQDGRMALRDRPDVGETYGELLGRNHLQDVEALGSWTPPPLDTPHGLLTFGAQFAEVAVDPELGLVRVRRMAGVFAPGRVLNPKTARSQLMGGMLWGLGQALLEGNRMDPRHGRWGATSLGDYLVPVNADAPDVTVRVRRGPRRGRQPARRQGRRGDRPGRRGRGDRQRGLPRDRTAGPRAADGRRAGHGSALAVAASLPERPAVSAPATPTGASGRPAASARSARAARQPYLGLLGLLLVVPVAALVAVGVGGPESSLRVLGPLVTFALPVVAMVAFWWEDWPGSSLRPGWSGLVDTMVVAVLAVVLTLLGLLVVDGDPGGVFTGAAFPGHDAAGRRRVRGDAPADAGVRGLAAAPARPVHRRARRAGRLVGGRARPVRRRRPPAPRVRRVPRAGRGVAGGGLPGVAGLAGRRHPPPRAADRGGQRARPRRRADHVGRGSHCGPPRSAPRPARSSRPAW